MFIYAVYINFQYTCHNMHMQVNSFPDFREPMKKREWTFSKFVDELKSHMGRNDEYIYYQDALTDTVGSSIKHDFVHFNWRWLNDRKKRYNWGQLTTNLLLISQPGNITPCHYDEQHNYFCQVTCIYVHMYHILCLNCKYFINLNYNFLLMVDAWKSGKVFQ